jgi:peptide deformylase
MTVREILKMGDPRLLRIAQPVTEFDTDALHLLVADMFETMRAVNGAGLAAPQIGVDLQLVIFGTDSVNPRYPDAAPVPRTVLLNPVITPVGDAEEEGWEGCLSVPGLRGVVPRWQTIRYTGFDPYGDPSTAPPAASTPAWCSTSATTWSASCTRCGCGTSPGSATRKCCFRKSTRPKTTEAVSPGPQRAPNAGANAPSCKRAQACSW